MIIIFPSKITGQTYMEMTGTIISPDDCNGRTGTGVIPGWAVDGKRGVSEELLKDIYNIFSGDVTLRICNPIESQPKLVKEDSGPYTKEEIYSHISSEEKDTIINFFFFSDAVVFQGGVFCDWYEVAFAALASEYGIPMLGICAGQSEIILGTGGSVKKAAGGVDKHLRLYDEEVHCLCPVGENSIPFAPIINKDFLVNSIHARAVKTLSPVCNNVCAVDEDGNYEIICGDKIITTRFHPEGLTTNLEKKQIELETIFGYFRDMVYKNKMEKSSALDKKR